MHPTLTHTRTYTPPSHTRTRARAQFSAARGTIPACGSEHPGELSLTLAFAPPAPCNFYRRFFVLVEHQLPLLMDCMGTGYVRAHGEVQEQRPAPLRHAHVQAFRNR
jgi:hypothetical protein